MFVHVFPTATKQLLKYTTTNITTITITTRICNKICKKERMRESETEGKQGWEKEEVREKEKISTSIKKLKKGCCNETPTHTFINSFPFIYAVTDSVCVDFRPCLATYTFLEKIHDMEKRVYRIHANKTEKLFTNTWQYIYTHTSEPL